jgi:hypothetical protein
MLQLEKSSGAWNPVACCSGWGFYGRPSSGLGGFFSLAMDLQAFLDELACLPLIGGVGCGGGGNNLAFCLSGPWQIYKTMYLFFRMKECRLLTPHGSGIVTHLL